MMRIIILAFMLANIGLAQATNVYKCPGKMEGEYTYQARPCKGAKADEHTVKIMPSSATKAADTQGSESAVDGLKAIIKLYESKNFAQLVRERYAELYLAKSEEEVNNVIKGFEERYKAQEKLDELLKKYNSALTSEPEIRKDYIPQLSETGEMATFKVTNGALILYKLKTGKWGFHL